MSWGANTKNKFLRLPNQTIYTYNAHDCYETAKLFYKMRAELQDRNLGPDQRQWRYFTEWVQPLQAAVVTMQRRGLRLDAEAKLTYHRELNRTLKELDTSIRAYARDQGFTFTAKFPNSKDQVAKLLKDHLGLRGGHKARGEKRYSVDQKSLVSMLKQLRKRDEHARTLLYDLFHRSRLSTLKSRYLQFDVGPDGRVRATVKITGTKTFRYAYAQPALQQYPPEIRHIFVGDLVAIDYSQLEAKILAVLSGDESSLQVFRDQGDIHQRNTCDLFGWDVAEWESMEHGFRAAARNRGKSFLYEISYGGAGDSATGKEFCPCPRCVDLVPQTYDLSRDKMKAAALRWYKFHPAVKKFQDELLDFTRRHRYYDSPFGVRRWFTEVWGADLEREVKNVPMQMNAALLMNERQVRLDKVGAPIVLQKHDEFIFDMPPEPPRVREQRIADYRGIMEEPCPQLGMSFSTSTEAGENWGAHSPTNPQGLRSI